MTPFEATQPLDHQTTQLALRALLAKHLVCVLAGALLLLGLEIRPLNGLDNKVPHLERIIQNLYEVEVFRTDLSLGNELLLHPSHETAPKIASKQHHRKILNLPGLDERKGLEQLIERAESSGEDYEAGGILDKNKTSG